MRNKSSAHLLFH